MCSARITSLPRLFLFFLPFCAPSCHPGSSFVCLFCFIFALFYFCGRCHPRVHPEFSAFPHLSAKMLPSTSASLHFFIWPGELLKETRSLTSTDTGKDPVSGSGHTFPIIQPGAHAALGYMRRWRRRGCFPQIEAPEA